MEELVAVGNISVLQNVSKITKKHISMCTYQQWTTYLNNVNSYLLGKMNNRLTAKAITCFTSTTLLLLLIGTAPPTESLDNPITFAYTHQILRIDKAVCSLSDRDNM